MKHLARWALRRSQIMAMYKYVKPPFSDLTMWEWTKKVAENPSTAVEHYAPWLIYMSFFGGVVELWAAAYVLSSIKKLCFP